MQRIALSSPRHARTFKTSIQLFVHIDSSVFKVRNVFFCTVVVSWGIQAVMLQQP